MAAPKDNRNLADDERELQKRLFTDTLSFPLEYKQWLRNFIEQSDIRLPATSINLPPLGGLDVPLEWEDVGTDASAGGFVVTHASWSNPSATYIDHAPSPDSTNAWLGSWTIDPGADVSMYGEGDVATGMGPGTGMLVKQPGVYNVFADILFEGAKANVLATIGLTPASSLTAILSRSMARWQPYGAVYDTRLYVEFLCAVSTPASFYWLATNEGAPCPSYYASSVVTMVGVEA